VIDIPLALVTHAHANVHQELEEPFLIFKHIAPERRVVQRPAPWTSAQAAQ
jgi:hypothetical protein